MGAFASGRLVQAGQRCSWFSYSLAWTGLLPPAPPGRVQITPALSKAEQSKVMPSWESAGSRVSARAISVGCSGPPALKARCLPLRSLSASWGGGGTQGAQFLDPDRVSAGWAGRDRGGPLPACGAGASTTTPHARPSQARGGSSPAEARGPARSPATGLQVPACRARSRPRNSHDAARRSQGGARPWRQACREV